jgi:hypothetical protein
MRKSTFKPARIMQALAVAALTATTLTQAVAADTSMRKDAGASNAAMRSSASSEASEPGTIPAARPGLPQLSRGAEGPLRADSSPKADPALRDTNPLTANGLWETLPGNTIGRPKQEWTGSN